jgi:hypothetical protein
MGFPRTPSFIGWYRSRGGGFGLGCSAEERRLMVDITNGAQPSETSSTIAPDSDIGAAGVPRRGRPIIGAIAGLFFGLFLAIDLVAFGVIGFESVLVLLIPFVGLATGIALALWAPFGSRTE